jgi:hypothetical protein
MDAQLVWNTWRRILSNDELAGFVGRPGDIDPSVFRLTPQETAILADYASTPLATETMISMYRRGLVRNVLSALHVVPLTRRLLEASEHDCSAVAANYVQSTGYRDDGPNFLRIADGFIGYLRMHPSFRSLVLQDVLAVDGATIALLRRLGDAPPAAWPENAVVTTAVSGSCRYLASPAAVVVASSHDITRWLEDPLHCDIQGQLDPSTTHWLIYLPSPEAACAFAELSERAAGAFTLLAEPKTPADLSQDLSLPPDQVFDVIASLSELGVVVRETAR